MAHKKKDKSILVPVDFSLPSEEALIYASEMAAYRNARLVILHVMYVPFDFTETSEAKEFKQELRKKEHLALEQMDKFMTKAAKKSAYSRVVNKAKRLFVRGLPVAKILQIMDKISPVAVVMGNFEATDSQSFQLSEKVEQVLQLSSVPVTVVKNYKENK